MRAKITRVIRAQSRDFAPRGAENRDVTARVATIAPWVADGRHARPLAAVAATAALALAVTAALLEPMTWPLVVLVALSALTGAIATGVRQRGAQRRQEARLEDELRATIRELRRSRARVAHVADTERRRIERDLHDGCQQRLIALRVKLALAEEIAADESQSVGELIQEIAADAETALEDLHALVHGIYPAVLTDRGLADAARAMARAASVPTRVLAQDFARYPPDVEAAVYFTCVEALQNTAKHAGAGATARITLRQERGGLAFEVRDDGCGYDTDARGGNGLANMQDRLGAVGGRLRIASAPGCGAVIQGWVPEARPSS
jgi:signal transduction histidine kinase